MPCYYFLFDVFQEIAEGLEDLAGDRFGRKVLHYLLESRGRSQCHPTMTELLRHGDGNPNRYEAIF